ncbi:hypothetical protein D917_04754 [Trichinella nativa]|uniref:Uncharacterized protein n=1 Tax=Trichinella nativa TaxID=6335 RepID=A0A1Y3E7F8_9BILA|nr:hypothetical protein D917_04754 [Trichinella nativa]
MDHITRSVAPVVTTATTVLPAGFSPVPAPRKRNALKAKKQLEQSQLANVDGAGSRQIVADGPTTTTTLLTKVHLRCVASVNVCSKRPSPCPTVTNLYSKPMLESRKEIFLPALLIKQVTFAYNLKLPVLLFMVFELI